MNLPFEVYTQIGSIFFEDRFRISFDFFRRSILPAILSAPACWCFPFLVFAALIPQIKQIWLRVLMFCGGRCDGLLGSDLFADDRLVQLALSVFICLTVYIYYRISVFRKTHATLRFWLRALVLASFVLLLLTSVGETVFKLFVSSKRMQNFTDNLPVLDSPMKWIFGIGTVGAGYFVNENYNIDNAYLYYLLTTGLIGMSLLIILLIWMSLRLRKRIFVAAKSGDPRLQVYIFTFAVRFSHIISGMGVSVLHYLIPGPAPYSLPCTFMRRT